MEEYDVRHYMCGNILSLFETGQTFPIKEVLAMFKHYCLLVACVCLALSARAADLSTAPSEELLKTYAQLRVLHGSPKWAVAENVEWKRDAATFRFVNGRITLAAPVGGRVVAAYFEGGG